MGAFKDFLGLSGALLGCVGTLLLTALAWIVLPAPFFAPFIFNLAWPWKLLSVIIGVPIWIAVSRDAPIGSRGHGAAMLARLGNYARSGRGRWLLTVLIGLFVLGFVVQFWPSLVGLLSLIQN